MLVLLIIICVLIGLAYADYCLIDNAAHFGITYEKLAQAEGSFADRLARVVETGRTSDEARVAAIGNNGEGMDELGEIDLVVPPATGVSGVSGIEVASGKAERPGRQSPRRRPGSERRISGKFPAHPSVDAGVAAIGN